MTVFSYQVKVNAFSAIIPDDGVECFIECPRGAYSGKAQLYLRADDATAVMALASVSIEIKTYIDDLGDGVWVLNATNTFTGYIPVESSEADEFGNVAVCFRDSRWNLERLSFARHFNVVMTVTEDPIEADRILYYPETVPSPTVPYTLQEIVNEITAGLVLPSNPVTRNVACCGNGAAILEGLLATIGCELTLNPFTNVRSIVALGSSAVGSVVTTARSERLIATNVLDSSSASKVGKATVFPRTYNNYTPTSENIDFGGGAGRVVIYDGELSNKDIGVQATRKSLIETAVEAWYSAQDSDFDETFYGIIAAVPNAGITKVTWNLANADPESGHSTRVQNYQKPMPWFDVAYQQIGDTLIKFTLLGDMTDGSAQATIENLSEPLTEDYEATVFDETNSASDLLTGDIGLAIRTVHGKHYVLGGLKSTELVRFTLTEALGPSGYATAAINSSGPDDGTEIVVNAWAENRAFSGQKGIAWKQTIVGETSTTTVYWIVELQRAQLDLVRFVTTSTFGSTTLAATAEIISDQPDDGLSIVVNSLTVDSSPIGTPGIAWRHYTSSGVIYYVIEIGGSAGIDATPFELTANATWGSFNAVQTINAIKLLPDGSPGDAIVVKTLGRTRAKSGCRGIAIKRGSDYVAVELQQPAAQITATLYADLSPTSATASVHQLFSANPFPNDVLPSFIESLSVKNTFKLKGFSGSKCELQYDSENDEYRVSQITQYAGRIIGSVVADFDETDATCDLESVTGIDGALPPEFDTVAEATVQNTHDWTGTAETKARAEFNWNTLDWELYQIDCAEGI